MVTGRTVAVTSMCSREVTQRKCRGSRDQYRFIPGTGVAGVTRPPYGSPKMWRKLVAMAAAPRADLVLKSEVGVGDSFVFFRTQIKRPEKESNPDPHAKAEQRPSASSLPAWGNWIFLTNQLRLVWIAEEGL